jgi:DNA-binding SARP family transcriptional activator
MRVRVLGPLEVGDATGLWPRDRVVLAALAARLGDVLTAEVLADALWGERPPRSWPKVIHGCISRLRGALGADAIETVAGGYRLVRSRLDLDRDEFEAHAARGREFLATGAPERAVSALGAALDLWSGTPFPELEEWAPGRLEAARLGELRLAVQDDLLAARLECGEHAEVAVEGTVLVGEEPWRERRWSLLALAHYRCGRQAKALATIRTARRALGRELGLDPGSELVALERAILAQDPDLAAEHEARTSTQCPWRGLASYDAEDSETFFGRSGDISACLQRLDESPLLVLAGPSGCGKSSLLKAGLMPALHRSRGSAHVFSPGIDPHAALTASVAAAASDQVLCVDQFEELFTGHLDAAGRRGFLRDLASYAADRAAVVLTVRSDYLPEMSAEPSFAALAERGLHLVTPLGEEQLREAIEGPAKVAGLKLEHGLVDLLLRDASDQPGALPLLSYALAETWQRREGKLLTVDGYRASGGISGAVAASADRLCASLPESGQAQLRWLMLRMGGLADHGEPVRTPLPVATATDDPERARVLDLLVGARLVTSSDGTYELAHEALVRAWPQLRSWLEEDRDGQRLWRHLAGAATEWDALGRPDSELYQGVRLEAALDWAHREGSQPTRLERDFLDRSTAHADLERQALADQARRQRRQNRRLRALLAGIAILLVVSSAAAVLAVDQRNTARESRAAAVHESLVSRSLSLRSSKRDVAALLAVEAYRDSPDSLAQSALLGTFTEAPGFMGYRQVPYTGLQGAAIPGTSRVVLGSGTRLHIVDLNSARIGPLFSNPLSSNLSMMSVLKVSADGRRLAHLMFDPRRAAHCGSVGRLREDNGLGCTVLTVFDLKTRTPVFGPEPTLVSGGDVAIDRTGRLVAIAGGLNGDLVTYDVDRGRVLGRLPGYPRPKDADESEDWRDTAAVAFDRRAGVFLGSMAGPLRLVDARTMRVRRTVPTPPRTTHNFLTLARGNLLVGGGDRGLIAVDARSGRRRWYANLDVEEQEQKWSCTSYAVAEEDGLLYCGGEYGPIEERDLASGQRTGRRLRDNQRGETGDIAVAGDSELVEFGRGYYARWRLDGSGPVTRLVAPGSTSAAGYNPDGHLIATVPQDANGPHDVIDLDSGRRLLRADDHADPTWVSNRTLMLTRPSRGSVLVDVDTGQRRRPRSRTVARAPGVLPAGDAEHAWALTWRNPDVDLLEFDGLTGRLTGREFSLPGFPYVLRYSPQDQSVWVNYYREVSGSHLYREDDTGNTRATRIDLATGQPEEEFFVVSSAVTDAGGGRLVGTNTRGDLQEYDPKSKRPLATLPGAPSTIWKMEFSRDGTRFLAAGLDARINVYATDDWVRLGSIPMEGLGSDHDQEDILVFQAGHLRPDGQAVLVNAPAGVAEWSLEPDRLAAAACQLAGRNLTVAEWATYMGEERYHRTCPAYPVPE